MRNEVLSLLALLSVSCAGIDESGVTPPPGPVPGPGPEPEPVIVDTCVLGRQYMFQTDGSSVNALWYSDGYLFAGDDGHVHIYDLSVPMNPVETGRLSVPGKVRQIAVRDGKMFLANREGGSYIADISNIRDPKLICRYDCSELATGIDVAGNVLFLGHRSNGVEFVDISDPSHPKHIDLIKTPESQSVFYQNGYLYSGEWGKGMVTVFDARDMSRLSIVNTVKLQGYGDGLWALGDRLYVSTGHHHVNSAPKTADGDGHGVEIWDISNPAEPKFISRAEFDLFYKSGTDYWTPRPSGDGKTLFCSDVYNGAYVVDISDETNPKVIRRFQTEAKEAVTSVALADSTVYFSAGKAIYAIHSSKAKPAPREMGILPVNTSFRRVYEHREDSHFRRWQDENRGQIHGAAGYGDALYVACGDGGLAVLKQKPSGELYRFATGPSKFAGDLKVKGRNLYVAEGLEGIAIYRIGDDYGLSLLSRISGDKLGSYSSSRVSFWIMVPNDKYIISGNRIRGYLTLYNKGTDDVPDYKAGSNVNNNVGYNKYVSDKVCAGDAFPYITRSNAIWIDLSGTSASPSSANPSLVSALDGGVTHFKDGKALIVQSKYLKTVRSYSYAPDWTSTMNSAFTGVPRWDEADRLVLTNTIGLSVCVVDVKDAAKPVVVFTETTTGRPEAASFWKGKALIPCGYQGILMEK